MIKRYTKIIAHRGCPFQSHENTMKSFHEAVKLGTDMIEFDVRRTRDRILVAHHDPHITSNGQTTNIADLTFNELQVIAQKNGFEIPKIDQILPEFSGKVGLDIELKEPGCEEEVIELIRSRVKNSEIIFTSFLQEILSKIKQIDSGYTTGYLFEDEKAVKNLTIGVIDYLCPSYTVYNNLKHSSCFDYTEFSYAVWTVNTPELMQMLFDDPYVDAVITNCTDIALRVRPGTKGLEPVPGEDDGKYNRKQR